MLLLQMMMLKAKEILRTHSQFQIDSTKKRMKRPSCMPAEQTLSDPVPVVSPVKIGTPRKNYILASKTTGEKEKKVPISKVRVGSAPPPNFKAREEYEAYAW